MTQLELNVGPRVTLRGIDWVRHVPAHGHGTCGVHHEMKLNGEPTGYWVIHCGHPTANWPYYVVRPDGQEIYSGGIGLGFAFRRLAQAKTAAIADWCESAR